MATLEKEKHNCGHKQVFNCGRASRFVQQVVTESQILETLDKTPPFPLDQCSTHNFFATQCTQKLPACCHRENVNWNLLCNIPAPGLEFSKYTRKCHTVIKFTARGRFRTTAHTAVLINHQNDDRMIASIYTHIQAVCDLSMNNITQLPTSALFNLHFLEELRLAGNDLTHIPKGALSGLFNLKVLMLQNNQLRQVPSEALQNLRNLQSLRLDANHIYSVPHNSFSGLSSLRHLWLDDNSLTEVPVQGLSSLSSLQAMTLALNKITRIPDDAFANLSSLVVLDLNYNNLDEFPTAIKALINLKELGFHSNNIKSIPERAFMENPSLITIFFYDNPIQFVGKSAFQHLPELRTLSLNGATEITEFPDLTGTKSLESLTLTGAQITSLPAEMCEQLPNLQVLDLSYNLIQDLPTFNGCERLQKIDLHHNEIQEIQASTFQHLTALRSLVMEMPYAFQCCAFVSCENHNKLSSPWDKDENRSADHFVKKDSGILLSQGVFLLTILIETLTGARITSLPAEMCEQLPKLQVLDLSYNLIQDLPTFNGCERLQKIDLHHNEIQEIQASTFQHLTALRSLDLAWNKLCAVHPNAFSHLPSLIKLDLSSNLLSSLPVTGLHGLTHLKLAGNADLQELLSAENFPNLRVMEMPYAFQCCAFVSCENHNKLSSPWDKDENRSTDHFVKKDSGILLSQEDHDFEDFLLDFEEDPKALHSVQCTPAPGPFQPCDHLFGSWLIRTGVWIIVVLSLVCNGLVAVTVFVSPTYISPAKHLIGLLAVVNSLMGFSSGVLAVVDTLTFGSFAKYGAWWESGIGCRITGFMSVFSSETCIFLLTTAALERGLSIKCAKRLESKSTKSNVKIVSAFCFILALAITVLPLLHVGEYGISSLCLPLPFGEPSSLGFMVALVLLNSLCYFVMTVTYTRLYCNLEKGELDNFWDCSMIKHVAWLLFANCILYFPVAFLSFSSLLNLSFISPEVIKSILLVIVPLPACLNPLLYMLFNPHFKEDLSILLKQTRLLKKSKQSSLVSLNSEDAEKQSCDSTQALVTFTSLENPGPFQPCDHLFGSWLIRTGVWIIVVLSLVCNGLVAVTVFVSPTYISPAKHLIGLLAVVNSLMGFSSGVLAVVDTLTFGSFAKYGAWWESGIGCRITGFMSVFSSETCIFLLTTAALERGLSIKCAKRLESKSTKSNVKIISAFCFILALAITVLPLLHVGEYGISSLCLPLPFGEPSSLGFMVALVLLNSLCYFVMTVTYTRLYCNLEKGELDNFWDCSMIKHVAWLLFANCILYFPVAFLSFSSLLNLSFISPEVIKSILLVIVPLPACLNPLLYMLFNPHFKEDLSILLKQTRLLKKSKQSSLVSLNSEDAEKQSCDSTQALVTFTSLENPGDAPESKSISSASQIIEACHSQSVVSVPCH
ncbi:UNVERIFIED_CONTAM: hypothetical protein FKN15_049909 [Acipenser sinensis]